MTERIKILTEMTLKAELLPTPVVPEFDRMDLLLPKIPCEAKRLCEYILAQEPVITEYHALSGYMRLINNGGCIVGDAFHRGGHSETKKIEKEFYLKSIDNLSTYEAQHAAADYKKVLEIGLGGIVGEIDASLKVHTGEEEIQFLTALKDVAFAIIGWAHKCSQRALKKSRTVENPEYKNNLETLSKALMNVPEKGAKSFYEALVCMNLCFSFDPDSFGTLDRFLRNFYNNDIKNGVLTREKAKEYLQEFLLTPQNHNSTDTYKTRGGQSHFCVGGYDENGNDSFDDITRLILEALMELPTCIPEVSFRWTPKTPHEVMKYVMDLERHDKNKRIAFTNDEKRMKCLVDICGIPFEKAIRYTMVGCNEICFPGAISASTSKGNVLKCIETLFHKKTELIENAKDFDEFYIAFEKELYSDLDMIYAYDDKYNLCRARDINYVSCLFFNGCIESARSLTRGGSEIAVSAPMLIGLVNLIDSLITVKQFVFDEKLLTMSELIKLLQSNWETDGDKRSAIIKKGIFFGSNDERSNKIAARVYHSLYVYLNGKKNVYGYPIVVGDHTGYNEHFKWFGEKMRATPDGRMAGEPISFGLNQKDGRDKEGLTALLSDVAQADSDAIGCGSTVTNIRIEESLIRNDDSFDKIVSLFESYFKSGGVHFQLNYVSKEELLAAKENPEKYKSLRVRVTGFSDYFVNLCDSVQDDIIRRTEKNRV